MTSLFCSRYYNKYLQLFTINMIFSVGLSYVVFIMLMYTHSILILLRVCITNKSWDLWKDFYHPLRLSYSFQFPMCLCGASHWFVDIELSLHSLVRSHFILLCVCVRLLSDFSHVWFFETPWTVAHQARLSMWFSRKEYWSGLPWPSPEDHPNPGIEPMSLMSPSLTCRFFAFSTTWETQSWYMMF